MDKNEGYEILKATLFDNGRGIAMGYHPKAPSPYVTWRFTEEAGERDYYWGHYHGDAGDALMDYTERIIDFERRYGVKRVQVEAPRRYKYYSTQRPVDIGTFPKPAGNEPDELAFYDERVPVEHGAFLAWGHIAYSKPLTEKEISDYELRPARDNPDVQRRMSELAEAVGEWEEKHNIAEIRRLTWYHPDFGSYAVKEHVTVEMLTEATREIEMLNEKMRQPAPIAEQLRAAQRQVDAQPVKPGPDRNTPDIGDDR